MLVNAVCSDPRRASDPVKVLVPTLHTRSSRARYVPFPPPASSHPPRPKIKSSPRSSSSVSFPVETIGWAFRLWGALAFTWLPTYGGMWEYPQAAFLGQITTLIIAPAFSTAALYIILGVLVARLGEQYCRLPARSKSCTVVFVTRRDPGADFLMRLL